jgi:hypothetical protein
VGLDLDLGGSSCGAIARFSGSANVPHNIWPVFLRQRECESLVVHYDTREAPVDVNQCPQSHVEPLEPDKMRGSADSSKTKPTPSRQNLALLMPRCDAWHGGCRSEYCGGGGARQAEGESKVRKALGMSGVPALRPSCSRLILGDHHVDAVSAYGQP